MDGRTAAIGPFGFASSLGTSHGLSHMDSGEFPTTLFPLNLLASTIGANAVELNLIGAGWKVIEASLGYICGLFCSCTGLLIT